MLSRIQINKYGLLGLVLVTLMVVLRMLQVVIPEGETTNPLLYRFISAVIDPYVLLTVIPYVVLSILINRRLASRVYTKRRLASRDRFNLQNVYVGLQITMVLWIIGLVLGLNQVIIQVVYYVVTLAIGMVIPFLLFSNRESTSGKDDELEF